MRRILLFLVAMAALHMATLTMAGGHVAQERSGEEVFSAYCANCHTGGLTGFLNGAPNAEDSDDRAELATKGLEALVATTITGIGDMVARGGCEDCSDEELREAVRFMLAGEE